MSQSHDRTTLNLTENMPINQLVNGLIGLSLKDCPAVAIIKGMDAN